MQETERQQEKWESYWSDTRVVAERSYVEAHAIWDSDVKAGVELDLVRLKDCFDPALPVIDVGCGSGKQTARLAQAFPRVIGTDVSASAVDYAAKQHPAKNLSYEVLDGLNLEAAQALHDRIGDANLYVRTVIHIFGASDRATLARSLRVLMGRRGTLYNVELGPSAPAYFDHWIETNGVPKKLAWVMSKGLRPGPVGRGDIESLFPASEYELVRDGDTVWPGVFQCSDKLDAQGRPEGALFEPPMYYSVVRKRGARN